MDRYSWRILAWLRKKGLRAADAEDVVQEVMVRFFKAIRRFDHKKGRFRAWLQTITRNCWSNFWEVRKREQRQRAGVDELLSQIPAREFADVIEAEWQASIVCQARGKVSADVNPRDWQIFLQLTTEGRGPEDVAAECGLTRAHVDVVKNRVLRRLRDEVRRLIGEQNL